MARSAITHPHPGMPVPPNGWALLTTVGMTTFYVRVNQVVAYGDAPAGFAGSSWIALAGTDNRQYVLETVDELTAIMG